MRWELLAVAAAVVFLGMSGRYDLTVSDNGAFRVDRLTGDVEQCFRAPEGGSVEIKCVIQTPRKL